jgi:tetratricopeptide (TPR) repeat protein
MRIYSTYIFLILIATTCTAQSVLDLFRSHGSLGDRAFYRGDYQQALVHYQLRAKRKPDDAWSKAQTARIYYRQGDKKKALDWYMNVRDTSLLNDADFMQIGDALHATGRSEEAEHWFKAFRSIKPADSRSARKILSIKEREKIYRDSLSYKIKSLAINTRHSEYGVMQVKSNLLFLSDRPSYRLIQRTPSSGEQGFLEIYKLGVLDLDEEPELFSEKLSSKNHEGPYCFLKGGKQIIFTKNNPSGKKLSLYFSELKKNEWIEAKLLPFNSEDYSVSHPWFNEDDSCLYFASDKPGGLGGTDIYKVRLSGGRWEEPVNLGSQVNTEGNEMFPFTRYGVLYFASDGHVGLGGLDIYTSDLNGRNLVHNIGYPVNSGADDFGIFIYKDDLGYFCSNREGGKGKDDIYEFRTIVQKITVVVEEKFSNAGVRAQIKINDLDEVQTVYPNNKGEWSSVLKPGHTYKLEFLADGYKNKDTTISIPSIPKKEMKLLVRMERRNKVFIRGFARSQNARPLPACDIAVVNRQTGEIEKAVSNNEGEFFAEVDPDYTYCVVVQNDTLFGYKYAENLPKKRGAFVTVIDVISQPYNKLTLEFSVKDKLTGNYLEDAELEIRNLTTGEVTTLIADKTGFCKVEVNDVSEYSIHSYCNDRTSEVLKFKGAQTNRSIILLMK